MQPSSMKYNPAFLDDKTLIESFVARRAELARILEVIRDNTAGANQHLLIIGPRGIGKTTLVLRSAAEVRTDPALSAAWHPVVFGEETYQVTTPGEFWLEALFHLGQQTGEERWQQAHEELLKERDEDRLRPRAISQLMDFADERGKRLLLIVENLHMLIGGQISGNAAWALRKTLMNEPRLMLLGTATSRFEEIDNYEKALYELFRIMELHPLEQEEARALWASTTGQETTSRQIRPLQILTGGNPRLIRILSEFAARTSFQSLMSDLTRLVDEHTEYFKHHLDNLPAQERKVFVVLADLWDPSTARTVAEAARIDVNTTSAVLKRLAERGAVTSPYKRGRAQYYQVAERMYNIYHLMRRRGPAASRVHAVVRFMVSLYRGDELVRTTQSLVEEARALAAGQRLEHFAAYEAIMQQVREPKLTRQILEATRYAFETMLDAPASVLKLIELGTSTEPHRSTDAHGQPSERVRVEDLDDIAELVHLARELSKQPDQLDEAEAALRKAIALDPGRASTLAHLSDFLFVVRQLPEEALEAIDRALGVDSTQERLWYNRGVTLAILERTQEALESYDRALEINPQNASAWGNRGAALGALNRTQEALESYDRALAIEPLDVDTWNNRGITLRKLGNAEEALASFDRALNIDPEDADAWANRSAVLGLLKRLPEALESSDRALELDPSYADAWYDRGVVLDRLGRFKEALEAFDRALEIDPQNVAAWMNRGVELDVLGHFQEALESFDRALVFDLQNAGVWGNRGAMLGRLGRPREALESFDRALGIDPQDADAWGNRGAALIDLERAQEALVSTDRALEIDPQHTSAWVNRGAALVYLGRTQEALEAYDRARATAPQNASVWHNRGLILRSLGREQEALESTDRALEIDSLNANAWSLRGSLLSALGREEEAVESYSRSLEIEPGNARDLLQRGLLFKQLLRLHDAEGDLRSAIGNGADQALAIVHLVELLLEDRRPEEAGAAARELADDPATSVVVLDALAWAFVAYEHRAGYGEAEAWARRAVEAAPERGFLRHTLACILGAQGKWDEALEQASVFLRDDAMLEHGLEEVIEFLIDAVAAGQEDGVLKAINAADGAEALEPLLVAIQFLAGAEVDVAREVSEVAQDVVRRVEARRGEVRSE